MALSSVVAALLLALALSGVRFSTSHVVKGTVSCLDCNRHYHLSGVKLAVKCDRDQRMAFTLTEEDGSFQAQLPLSSSLSSSQPPNCLATILGGPRQLCSSKKAMYSKIIKAQDSYSFTTTAPLTFSITCRSKDLLKRADPKPTIESSKTIDLPLPPEWGLPPTAFYVPFFPIIGVP